MSEPKNYASGQTPAAGDLCHFRTQPAGNQIRVDEIDSDGFVKVGFTSIDPGELIFVQKSDPNAPPPAPARGPAPVNGFAHVVTKAAQPPPPAPPPVPHEPLDAVGRLRAELAAAAVKLKPHTKDHVVGSAIARRVQDVIQVVDQMLIIFPELAAAAARKAKK